MKSVRILLAHALDYAGLFPPAGARSVGAGNFVVTLARTGETGLPPDMKSVVAGGTGTAGATVYPEKPIVRTGGVTADLFPAPEALADFLVECARLRLAFKATAGCTMRCAHALSSGTSRTAQAP